MYRLNIVSTNPTGSVQQQQQQAQQATSGIRPQQQQPPQLALVQTGGGTTTTTIIGLTSLNALNATTITGLAAAAAAGGSTSTATGLATTPATAATKHHILKAASNNNNISIVKIGDEIMLKAVKMEPLVPTDTGGSIIATSATTSSGVTVTAIPAAAPINPPAAATANGNVIYGGKRRLER